ncbi:DUF5610 domain-containing protein [Shewanella sp.]|uniref:DUF5610 domain-containing protein n=1 Tax=Shewanella sp. TaxID=50422 RepID=UPI003F2C15F5
MEINKPPHGQPLPLSPKSLNENKAEQSSASGDIKSEKPADAPGLQTVRQTSKNLMNLAILSAQQNVNIQSGDNSLTLLYRAAMDSINHALAPGVGNNAAQSIYNQGLDTSPTATADRIVGFATQYFNLHQKQNPAMNFDEQLDSFMTIIGDAIDTGFKDASGILSGLKVLQGDIANNIDKTYSLVQEGLQAFKESVKPDEAKKPT